MWIEITSNKPNHNICVKNRRPQYISGKGQGQGLGIIALEENLYSN